MTTEEIDKKATELAKQVDRGLIGEQDARNEIGALLYASSLAAEVARSRGSNLQDVEDLADDLRLFVWEKVRGIANARSGGWSGEASSVLDLNLIREGKSACGWARQLMKTRAYFRQSKKGRQREFVLPEGDTIADLAEAPYEGADTLSFSELLEGEIAEEQIVSAIRARRASPLWTAHLQARAVEKVYHLPTTRTRVQGEEAAWILAEMDASPTWAQEQVRHLVDCLDSNSDPIRAGVNRHVVAALGGLTPDVLEALNADHRTAAAIMRSVASARPPVGRTVDRHFRSMIATLTNRDRAASRVAGAFLASLSDLDESGAQKTQAQRREENLAFELAVITMLDGGQTGLGDALGEVKKRLEGLLAEVERDKMVIPALP